MTEKLRLALWGDCGGARKKTGTVAIICTHLATTHVIWIRNKQTQTRIQTPRHLEDKSLWRPWMIEVQFQRIQHRYTSLELQFHNHEHFHVRRRVVIWTVLLERDWEPRSARMKTWSFDVFGYLSHNSVVDASEWNLLFIPGKLCPTLVSVCTITGLEQHCQWRR